MTLFNQITQIKPHNPLLAYYRQNAVTQQQFVASVEQVYEQLIAESDKKTWALFCDDALLFAIGFFALLHAGKDVILPGNLTEATQQRLNQLCDATLTDQATSPIALTLLESAQKARGILPKILLARSTVTIFTSGSTGEPKAIVKQLSQIEAEMRHLQMAWDKELSNSVVIATVSHQHIYGLLFRVLWPLASERPFYSEQLLDSALAFSKIRESTQPVVWVASPAHLKRIDATQIGEDKLQQLVKIFSSGGPLPANAAQQCESLLKLSPTEVYGSSETGGIAFRQQAAGNMQWQTLPGVEVRCIEGSTNLQVKSAHVNCNDAWYITDDAAEMIGPQVFELKGRLDRIVKLEEKRLSLVELEQAICNSGWVIEALCWVLPQTKEQHRQTLSATLRLNEAGVAMLSQHGRAALVKAIKQVLQKQFELSLLPRKWRFVEQIPCNAQGKIDYQSILLLMDKSCEFQPRSV